MLKAIRIGVILAATAFSILAQSTKSDTATIHVYREKHMVAMLLKPSIYCDGVEMARLHNGTFFVSDLKPGKHTIMAGRSEVGLVVDFLAGEHYFFRLDHKNWAGTAATGRQPMFLSQVDADEAKPEMRHLKRQSLDLR